MHDLGKAMRALADEMDRLAVDFRRALLKKDIPPKQLLFDFQQRLDHTRLRFWDTRKLCDPFLVTSRFREATPDAASLAERVVRFVDAQRTQGPSRQRRSG